MFDQRKKILTVVVVLIILVIGIIRLRRDSSDSVSLITDEQVLTQLSIPDVNYVQMGDDMMTGEYVDDGVFTILVPRWVVYPEFVQLIQRIRQDVSIRIRLRTVDTRSDFFSLAVKPTLLQDIDMVLLPHDALSIWENSLTGLDIGEDLRVYMHPVFARRIYHDAYTFVPFAIDPYVVYTHESTSIAQQDQRVSWDDLLSYMITWRQNKALSMPMIFGIQQEDNDIWSGGSDIYNGYSNLVAHILYQWSTGQGVPTMQNFFRMQMLSGVGIWSASGFERVASSLRSRYSQCVIYPDLCVFANQFADIRIGNLSDIYIYIDVYTGTMVLMEDVVIRNFPVPLESYPVRGWGFVTLAQSSQQDIAQKIMQRYLVYALQNDFSIWDDVLSASMSVYTRQRIRTLFKDIVVFDGQFVLLDFGYHPLYALGQYSSLAYMLAGRIPAIDFASQLRMLRSGAVR